MSTMLPREEFDGCAQAHDSSRCGQLKLLSQYINEENYGGALALGLKHMTMVRVGGVPYALIAAKIARECPTDIKRQHPDKLLRLAYELYAGGLADEYSALMRELQDIIPLLPVPECERRHLLGEWLIVSALPMIRDVRKVVDIYEQAVLLMQGPSAVIDAADPITFGVHGMPGAYLLRSGTADEVLACLPRLTELFSRLTGEPLCGLEELYEGSLAYYRGDLEKARVLTYKAIYLLERTKQDVLRISAGEQLALIAVHQADADCFEEALEYMETAMQRSENREACRCLMELIRCGLFNTLEEYKATPEWLKSFAYASGDYGTGPFGDRNMAGNPHFAPVSYGVACWYHTLYLSTSGQYRRALAAAEIMLKRLDAQDGSLILELYFSLEAARAHMALGNREAARELVNKAVGLALPDRFYLVPGIYAACFDGMVEEELAKRDKEALDAITRINGVYVNGIRTLQAELMRSGLPESLTRRERDVARLAAKGMRNGEIAEALSVSESTVRAHLRSVFQKLEIDRRAKLAEKLQEKEWA